jgi:hypothetical protein
MPCGECPLWRSIASAWKQAQGEYPDPSVGFTGETRGRRADPHIWCSHPHTRGVRAHSAYEQNRYWTDFDFVVARRIIAATSN